jgi:hypothetical protein
MEEARAVSDPGLKCSKGCQTVGLELARSWSDQALITMVLQLQALGFGWRKGPTERIKAQGRDRQWGFEG